MDEAGRPDVACTYDLASDEPASEGVVRAVAAAAGLRPVPRSAEDVATGRSLAPLHEAVDPDALDALFPGDRGGGDTSMASFRYHGFGVEVRGDGRVTVHRRHPVPEGSD